MLLWILILALFGLLVGEFGNNLPPSLRARVLSIQGLIGAGFIAFLLFTSNPFSSFRPNRRFKKWFKSVTSGSGFGLPSALSLFGLCRLFHGFFICDGCSHRGRVDPAWARFGFDACRVDFSRSESLLGVGGPITNLVGAAGGFGTRLKMHHFFHGSWARRFYIPLSSLKNGIRLRVGQFFCQFWHSALRCWVRSSFDQEF